MLRRFGTIVVLMLLLLAGAEAAVKAEMRAMRGDHMKIVNPAIRLQWQILHNPKLGNSE